MRSITRRLVQWYVLILAGILFVCGLAAFFGTRYLLLNEAGRELMATINTVHRMADPEGGDLDAPELAASIDNGIQWVQITSSSGQVLNSSSALKDRPLPAGYVGPPITYNLRGQVVLLAGAKLAGGALVQIARPLSKEEEFLSDLAGVLGALSLAGLLLAFAGGWAITRAALRPIKNLTRTARSVTTADLSRRIPLSGPRDELYELAKTLNQMLDRLEDGFKAQMEFLAAASHDLRTPLAVIRSYTDILNRWGKEDPAVVSEAIPAITKAVAIMERLVNDLLLLVKIQTRPSMHFAALPLDELAAEVVQEAQAINGEVTIELGDTLPIKASIDEHYMHRALWVLVDNAVKYNEPGGRVVVSVSARGQGEAIVSVADTGRGIPAKDMPRIFDRFFRGDPARSQGKGFGLGLSLAREIVTAHGGAIEVESRPGVGSVFTIVLPVKTGGEV